MLCHLGLIGKQCSSIAAVSVFAWDVKAFRAFVRSPLVCIWDVCSVRRLGSNVIRVVSSLIAAVCKGFSGGFRQLGWLPVVVPFCGFGPVVLEVNTPADVLSRDVESGTCDGGRFSVVLLLALGVSLLARLK